MIRGLYTAAAGALVAQTDVDNIANNLANVSTAGFKQTLLQVQSDDPMQIARLQTEPGGQPTSAPVGDLGVGAQVFDTPTSFAQGTLVQTGNPLDLAVTGDAFFRVQTPQGVRYTRDGSFVRNAQGLLATKDGGLVADDAGRAIALPQGTLDVAADGTLKVDGATVGRLGLTSFRNPRALGKAGGNLYYDAGGSGAGAGTGSTVSQGRIEASNANVVRSMVDLIAAQRWFDANEKAISTEDAATSQALQTVGNSKG